MQANHEIIEHLVYVKVQSQTPKTLNLWFKLYKVGYHQEGSCPPLASQNEILHQRCDTIILNLEIVNFLPVLGKAHQLKTKVQ